MTGFEKAKEVADSIKAEKAEKDEQDKTNRAVAISQLQQLKDNPSLAAMYAENAKVGSENIAGNAPYLKIHAAGKSSTNLLADGKKPNDGWFFYAPTQEQFESVECHIMAISRGFKAESMPDGDGNTKMIFNQIMGGVVLDGGDKPFLMYLTGLKLNPMWEFGKEASRFTKAGIPMFALKVKLRTEEVPTKWGNSWVPKFEIMKNEDGDPELVLDPVKFQYLKDSTLTTQETIEELVKVKTSKSGVDALTQLEEEDNFAPPIDEADF